MKVSVIVPVYNTDLYLNRCMNSLIHQTLKDIEIIIVDDGSKMKCSDLCDEWGKKDKRIRVIHKKNQGLGLARNTGIENAKGKYIAFVDSDDYVAEDMYEKLYDEMERENLDFITSGYWKEFDNGYREKYSNPGIPEYVENEKIYSVLLANMLGSLPNYPSDDHIGMSVWKGLYSNKILQEYKIRFQSERILISEDIVFHIDYMMHVKRAKVLQEAYYYYCQNQGSLTTTYRRDRFEKVVTLYKYEEDVLKKYKIFKYGMLQLQRTFLANIRVCIMQEAARGKYVTSKKEAKRMIKQYCNCKDVKKLLNEYPWIKLPIKQRVFSLFMKMNCAGILYILANMQMKYKGKRIKYD